MKGPELEPGVTIERGYGRIVVDAKIAEGGMGIVYRGWLFYPPTDPRAEDGATPLALKVLRPEARARDEVRRFFRGEVEALRHLSHPNIVRFYDVFDWPTDLSPSDDDEGRTVLAMEYVDGGALVEIIARHVARAKVAGGTGLPGIPFRRAWYYFQQLLGALAAIHKVGIVHRDVKPANVLVRRDGLVKLTDFGIARVELPGRTAPHERAIAPGTGAYMSPEQVQGKPLDGRSDLYSAAVVLYEMICGRPPFSPEGKSELFVRQEHLASRPPPVRTFVVQAPPVLDALFARALAKDPALRFDNALEMGDAFRAALGLPDSPEWHAQKELAEIARVSILPGATPKRAETLRDFLVQRYRTERMQR